MATTPTEQTTLQSDAELEQRLAAARKRDGLLKRLLNPLGICVLLAATLGLPLLLLPLPLGIVVGMVATAGSSVGLGMAKGAAQHKVRMQMLDCLGEQNARSDDPLRRAKALDETFGKAVTAGVTQNIKIKKPLKLKTGITP